jgi:hypothetical protein
MVVIFRRFRDHDFRREQPARNRRRILQRETRNLAGSRMPSSSMSPYSPVPALTRQCFNDGAPQE